MTCKEFIETHRIKMTAEWADSNPNMNDMPDGSSHYKCRFARAGRSMTVHYSMGPAHREGLATADVLDCLASDAAGVENAQGFADWCGDCGYSEDSRRAEKTFKVCERQAKALRRFLGSDAAYKALLFDCERS